MQNLLSTMNAHHLVNFHIYRASTGNLVKNMGNIRIFCQEYGRFMGFFNKNMGGIWEKIRVYKTKANIEDKSESKFIRLKSFNI